MKILLPVDGSELSLEAVRFAIRMILAGLRADAVLANVQEPANLYELLVAHDPEVINKVSEEAGRHTLLSAQALLDAAGVVMSVRWPRVTRPTPLWTLPSVSPVT